MTDSSSKALDPRQHLGLTHEQLPRHIAIIMDGNGRWAKDRNQPRIFGHQEGANAVRRTITHAARLGIEAITLYSFSIENWKRPQEEIDFLMELCREYLIGERQTLMENNIRMIHLGRREELPESVLKELDLTIEMSSANTGLTVGLALNYGSRTEIVEGVQSIARKIQAGELKPEEIDERLISETLYTAGLPDPDLLIRTSSEYRISNFLLWQISYSELFITSVMWPDFDESHLDYAIQEYARRERRYGDVEAKRPQ